MGILEILLIIVLVGGGIGILFFTLSKKEVAPKQTKLEDKAFTIPQMLAFVKKRIDEITKMNITDIGLSEEELKRRKNKKYELKKALKGCTYGDVNDKRYVKDLMFDLLVREYGLNQFNISKAINFDNYQYLTVQDKFDIIIYVYIKEYGAEALNELIKKYKLDELKCVYGSTKPCYVIIPEEIEEIFEREIIEGDFTLTFEDKVMIICQRIYQMYKGYSVVDEVRDMNIDGVSGGVSGLPDSFMYQLGQVSDFAEQVNDKKIPRACDSVWIFYKGKSIRLAFLSFGSEEELKRVCQNIYKYNNPGQLSDTNGYKINEMKDGSRVVVVRPQMSESWAFFVRKFDVQKATLEQLVTLPGYEFTIPLLRFLVKGARVTSLTGEQGCGKTTMLMAMIDSIYDTYNIRVQETAFELHLRKIYPTRNILTFRETETISGQDGLDVQKKTDGSVNILGEVATHPVAAWMIQMAQVASKFTLFTHHAKTFPNLVTALRNSLLAIGMFNDEKVAEMQVVGVLNFDIHLKKDFNGLRFIERITECVPVENVNEYSFEHRKYKNLEEKMDVFIDNATHYFTKITDKKVYEGVNILEYVDGRYVLKNPISDYNMIPMIENMSEEDALEFADYIIKHWPEQKKKVMSNEIIQRLMEERRQKTGKKEIEADYVVEDKEKAVAKKATTKSKTSKKTKDEQNV
ncbi:MAG: pilus assembly protein CpaF [Clostridiales bacterium]|nr:pilus assembly protein CpaF [Clostridiales bacterium]